MNTQIYGHALSTPKVHNIWAMGHMWLWWVFASPQRPTEKHPKIWYNRKLHALQKYSFTVLLTWFLELTCFTWHILPVSGGNTSTLSLVKYMIKYMSADFCQKWRSGLRCLQQQLTLSLKMAPFGSHDIGHVLDWTSNVQFLQVVNYNYSSISHSCCNILWY